MFYQQQDPTLSPCIRTTVLRRNARTARCKSMDESSLFRATTHMNAMGHVACGSLPSSTAMTSSVDDIEQLSECLNQLPPPEPLVVSKRQPPAGAYSRRAASASVSLTAPHCLLSVSKPLCQLLGYEEEELSGRTIRILQGPKSNPKAFTSAIKSAALSTCRTERTTIYDKEGKELDATISCSPFFGADGMLAGCKMDISFHDGACTPARRHSMASSYRAHYNFITGMRLHQALEQHERRANAR